MPANRRAPLVRKRALGGGYFLLAFRHPEVAQQAEPGQFVMIKAGTAADLPLRRPFSVLATDRGEDSFALFVKAVGAGSRALAALDPGDLSLCLGPLGTPFELPRKGSEAVLVAGGYGIAPFHLFCERSARAAGGLRVFYGGRGAPDVLLREPFERMGVPLTIATEDGSLGERGRVTEALEAYLGRAEGEVALYACGPDAMLHAVARIAERRGLPLQVSLDPWMGCGIGTCLGCVVRIQAAAEETPRHRCACTEGPVFDACDVVWPRESMSLSRRRALGRAS